jgi:hypothetical protein
LLYQIAASLDQPLAARWASIKKRIGSAMSAVLKGFSSDPPKNSAERNYEDDDEERPPNVSERVLRHHGASLSVLKLLFPKCVTTTECLGRAMLNVAKRGAPKSLLENQDINRIC